MKSMSDQEHTLYVGNLHSKVTDTLLYELFLQVGPLQKVKLVFNGETKKHKGYAFVTFKHECSLEYAINVLDEEKLFGRSIIVKHRNRRNQVDDKYGGSYEKNNRRKVETSGSKRKRSNNNGRDSKVSSKKKKYNDSARDNCFLGPPSRTFTKQSFSN